MENISYTYLIGWSSLNKWYYGVQYGKTANPKNLWSTYFTSSKFVLQIRKEYGEPDIIQVRQTFTDNKKALLFEDKVLKRLKVVGKDKWLNQHVGGNLKSRLGCKFTDEHKNKIAEKSKLHKHSEETKQKIREKALGRKLSQEAIEKIRQNNFNRLYKPHSEETKRKISESKIGNIPWNKGQKGLQGGYKQSDYQKQRAADANSSNYKITFLDESFIIIKGIRKWFLETYPGMSRHTFDYRRSVNKKLEEYNILKIENV